MEEKLLNLKNQAISSILQVNSASELEGLRIAYLGRKGQVTEIIKELSSLPIERRKEIGRLANEVKRTIEETLRQAQGKLQKITADYLDVSMPGVKPLQGHLHLVTQTIEEITHIFERIGFTRVSYPEIEWDWYAFEGLNMPKNHPARDEWETFFIEDLAHQKYGEAVLTPHTSSGQLREMERVGKALPAARLPAGQGRQVPIRMLNIAKCYRRQADVSHAPMFYQFETLVIDKSINITHLKGTLDYFAKEYFGPNRKTRIRPFHFQFTEPSFEVDVTCIVCGGRGCRVCKQGWLELGGAGMVHPQVLRNGGINPQEYTGFASGFGLERVLMMKYGIDDIRLLFSSDLRFLNQF